ncbi:hypothetical protein AKJ09_10006 [Labilithrix luteola]|uniref:Uncharacterized protein n=1 Tax=Labilithrix luteola TaxID=1391654 RepID=A0A0K1QC91_9BACT|nr:hypothetical protein AKJ09_10006 [Labilithrix luteola]
MASAMEELRRLYLAGETEAALAVAESVRPAPVGTPWPLDTIPLVNMTAQQIMQLPLDPQSGFLLARIDGMTPLKTILDISAMPHESAMHRIEHLVHLGAVRMLVPRSDTPTLS